MWRRGRRAHTWVRPYSINGNTCVFAALVRSGFRLPKALFQKDTNWKYRTSHRRNGGSGHEPIQVSICADNDHPRRKSVTGPFSLGSKPVSFWASKKKWGWPVFRRRRQQSFSCDHEGNLRPSSAPVCALGHLPPRGKAFGCRTSETAAIISRPSGPPSNPATRQNTALSESEYPHQADGF